MTIHSDDTDKELNVDDVSDVQDVESPEVDSEVSAPDEVEPTKETKGKEEKPKDYRKLSLRDTIRDAKEQEERKEEPNSDKKEKSAAADLVKEALDPANAQDKKENLQAKQTNAAPVSWSKEAKAEWDKVPDSVKAAIAKREKEASDGFKSYGEKTKRLDALDQVLKPREAAIKQLGVSEAQTVDRMFQWMEALANPNKQQAAQHLAELARNFGITFPTNGADTQTQQSTQQVQQPNTYVDNSQLTEINNKLRQIEQREQQNKETQARDYLNNWAKDKVYFDRVRDLMFTLLQNQSLIPLNNGSLDLDKAYELAINATPDVAQEHQAKIKEEADQKAENERKAAELKRLQKLNASKKASTLSNRAPTGTANGKNQPRKPTSVRESILAARQEVRDNS